MPGPFFGILELDHGIRSCARATGFATRSARQGAIQLRHYTDSEVISEIDVVIPDGEIEKQIDVAAAAE